MEDGKLTEKVIGCSYRVYNALGSGYLEKVYENTLRIELEREGLTVKQQEPIKVRYEDQIVGDFYADLGVEDGIIVELKAVQELTTAHEVQLVNYLTATGVDAGLLINFGSSSVKAKRKHRVHKPPREHQT